jgi:hypothetical protein
MTDSMCARLFFLFCSALYCLNFSVGSVTLCCDMKINTLLSATNNPFAFTEKKKDAQTPRRKDGALYRHRSWGPNIDRLGWVPFHHHRSSSRRAGLLTNLPCLFWPLFYCSIYIKSYYLYFFVLIAQEREKRRNKEWRLTGSMLRRK